MLTPEKIEEWLKEVQERPSSAPLIIQYLANRLRDLDEWNEKLRVENLELRTGNRVEEYERQINHLEYQLDLLKRQVGGEVDLESLSKVAAELEPETLSLLVYGPQGKLLRLELDPSSFKGGHSVCRLEAFLGAGADPPRLLVAPSTEELMFIFTSGRIITLPVAAVPVKGKPGEGIDWGQIYIPEEPNVGETLACVVPISKIALSDFYLQISRRGYAKKIRKALAPTIMENKYIGTGVKVPADQTLTLSISKNEANFVLVSYEGYVQYIPEAMLPYAIVEAMRLGNTDHLVSAFPAESSQTILVMTQIGKAIHRTVESLEVAGDLGRKGRMLYSTERRQAGVRVVGAAAAGGQGNWSLALHTSGDITLHPVPELIGTGSIQVDGELLDFITFSPPGSPG